MKFQSTLRSFLLATGSSLLAITSAHAATLTWDADSGTTGAQDGGGNWTVGGTTFWNGTTNVATANSTATDIARFGNGGTLASPATVNVSTQSINGLIFGATTTSGYSLTASSSGQILTLGASGIVVNSGAQATTVGSANLGITLDTPQTWTNNSSSLLTIAGAVSNGANLLTVTGSGNTTISGLMGNGAGGLTKTGTGTLTLNGSSVNNFTGGVNISGGTLAINLANLGTPTDLIHSSNTLTLAGGALSVTGKNVAGVSSQSFASTTLGAGLNTLTATRGGASATSANLNLGALTVNPGSITTFDYGGVFQGTGTTSSTSFFNASSVNGASLPTEPTYTNAGLFHRISAAAGSARWVQWNSAGNFLPSVFSTTVGAATLPFGQSD